MRHNQLPPSAPYYYILWGTIVALYSIARYYAITYSMPTFNSASLLFLAGGILSYRHAKRDRSESLRIDKVYLVVWLLISLGILVANIAGAQLGIEYTIPITLTLYCLGAFITGLASRFWPSIAGAILCTVCVAWSFYEKDYAAQNLLMAAAVATVHIIPGLIMRNKVQTSLSKQ